MKLDTDDRSHTFTHIHTHAHTHTHTHTHTHRHKTRLNNRFHNSWFYFVKIINTHTHTRLHMNRLNKRLHNGQNVNVNQSLTNSRFYFVKIITTQHSQNWALATAFQTNAKDAEVGPCWVWAFAAQSSVQLIPQDRSLVLYIYRCTCMQCNVPHPTQI